MNSNSRTSNSIRNSSISIITQILTVIMDFIVKTIFIRILGNEYLGINGLFSNIITLLSIADLGIGLAIPYSLYKPLANKDTKKIQGLTNYYRRIYNIIGIIVLIIGLSITPFLKYIIKEMPNIPDIYFIYILFVTHSALSYFFVYKRFLIEADQKGSIISKITFACSIGLNITRITLLVITKNYILFLFCSIIFVLIQNIWYSKKANKLYPYIAIKNNEQISNEDKQEISKNVKSLLIYKIGNVITSGTDNIVISMFIGIIPVGIYSNYILIINSLNNILLQLFNAITSSIGNLVVTNNERSKNIFEKLNFFNFYIFSLFSVCIFVLINSFITLWLGNDYVLSTLTALTISINFYISGMQAVTNSFRSAYGLFYKAKYRPIIMVILNLVISIILVNFFGVLGVVLGTIISRLCTTSWIDPLVIYKYGFKENVHEYYKKYIYYFAIFGFGLGITYALNSFIIVNNFIIWIISALVTFIVYNLIIYIIFKDSDEFKYFTQKINIIIKKYQKVK